ncbi:actin depolymerizing factor 11 [Striga asiatica]|uniref:Actin depolymerizing factor 11 n=1 Tax=Striga asiatica TaxID=4170 RepID=A0A5A7PCE5_STRAF|nr:actin depolymerizing factor 11 [Striga asiatica]
MQVILTEISRFFKSAKLNRYAASRLLDFSAHFLSIVLQAPAFLLVNSHQTIGFQVLTFELFDFRTQLGKKGIPFGNYFLILGGDSLASLHGPFFTVARNLILLDQASHSLLKILAFPQASAQILVKIQSFELLSGQGLLQGSRLLLRGVALSGEKDGVEKDGESGFNGFDVAVRPIKNPSSRHVCTVYRHRFADSTDNNKQTLNDILRKLPPDDCHYFQQLFNVKQILWPAESARSRPHQGSGSSTTGFELAQINYSRFKFKIDRSVSNRELPIQ